nr:MAG TPA: Endo N acetylneuraminidase [Caudoviricetes sp.]
MDYKEIFYKDSVEKQVTIKSDDGLIDIGNGDFEGETMELTESVCDKDELTFGACSAAQLSFTVSGGFSLQGKWLNVDIGLKSEDAFASPYRLGRYKVNSDKPTADRTSRNVIAYDALYDILQADVADWYNTILPESDSRVYLKDFRDSFFNHFGIEQEDITLVNDDMWVEKTVKAGELSGAAVINCICEINGCMGHIDRAGKFEYIYLEPISAPDDISKSLYTSAAYEDYIVQPIDKLQIRQEEDDIGVIVGDGSNSYIIEDNFLVYGKSSAELTYIANNIFTKIKGLAYRPFTVECIGNPCITVGAPVRVTSTYATIDSYVFTRTLKGVQSLSDTYAAAGNEYRTGKVNSIQKQIIQLKGRSNVLSRTIEETRNTITDIEQGLKNEITATASEFDVKLQNLQSEIDGQIEVINGHGQPTLDNYPAYNWTSGPRTGDKLVEGLRFTYSDEVYRKHQRTLFFDEATATTYRFIKKDDVWVWEPLGNTEYSVLQKQITDLSVTAQGITESMEELSVKISNEYITQVAAETLVSKTANGIKEDISKVYTTKDDVSSFRNSIEKTAAGITAQISEINEALDGANEVYTIRGQPTLSNYPAYNWTAGPKAGDKLAEGLRFTYSDESYRKHNRALVYDVVGGKTYRFVKNGDTWGFTDVGDTEFSWVNKKLAEYKATAYEASVALSKLETKVGSDYITKVESQASIKLLQDSLTEQFSKTYATLDNLGNYSTTTQMNTAIETSAKGVLTTVSSQYATQGTVDELVTSVGTTAEGLKVKISKNEVIATINASAEQVQIAASKLDLQGLVTISSLEKSGETIINADNITTGTINALKIKGCEIEGSAIAFRNNSGGWSSVINADGMWIIGEGDADNPDFRVNNKGELTARRGRIGNWDIGSGAIANNGTVLTADGQLVLSSDNNAIQLGSNARLIPTALYVNQNGYSGSVPWWGVYKAAAQAVASDERIKQDIESISDEAYDRFFNSLQTYTYRFREGSGFKSDKTHIGFISQHIKKNLDETGLSCLAVYDDDNPDLLGVDKQELIALCVWQIQKLKARVKELETNTGGAA